MARKVYRETRHRGFFGWIFLGLFWLFNLLMIAWLLSYWAVVGGVDAVSEAEKAGHAIGGALGTGMLIFVWVSGAVILGLFALLTRGRKTVVEEID